MQELFNYIICCLFQKRFLTKTYVGYDSWTDSYRVYIELPFADLEPIVHDIVFISDYRSPNLAYLQAKRLAKKAEKDANRWYKQLTEKYNI